MLIVGLPYTEPDLRSTASGGTPYGASHVGGIGTHRPYRKRSDGCASLGARLAAVALKLS
jgi:NAD(P)H dehydrogenase (quinone)